MCRDTVNVEYEMYDHTSNSSVLWWRIKLMFTNGGDNESL